METKHKHKIDKIHLRISTHSEEDGHYLKDNAGKWVNAQVLSCLEDYIAGVEDEIGQNILQFEKLNLSLEMKDGKLNDSSIYEQIKSQLDAQIRAFLRNMKNPGSFSAKDNHENDPDFVQELKGNIIDPVAREAESLLHFLKTGRCPWWMTASELNELLAEKNLERLIQTETEKFYKSFTEQLRSTAFRSRLVRQFSHQMLYQILMRSFYHVQHISLPVAAQEKRYGFIEKLTASGKEAFWFSMIHLLQHTQQNERIHPDVWVTVLEPFFALDQMSKKENLKQVPTILETLTQLNFPENLKAALLSGKIHEETFLSFKELASSSEKSVKQESSEEQSGEFDQENQSNQKNQSDQENRSDRENQPDREQSDSSQQADQEAQANQKNQALQETPKTLEEELKKGMIVENAGLILLMPYLKNFLLTTTLLNEKNEFSDPELAVHILHYIATGRQHDWDHNLLFEKFLCNVPLHESIEREREIPETIQQEVGSLLEAVVENWTAIGKSSIELLRNEFFQRQGKLFMDEMSVRLVVERKTQDILLDRIPWGFSTAKLSWQKHLIYTTW